MYLRHWLEQLAQCGFGRVNPSRRNPRRSTRRNTRSSSLAKAVEVFEDRTLLSAAAIAGPCEESLECSLTVTLGDPQPGDDIEDGSQDGGTDTRTMDHSGHGHSHDHDHEHFSFDNYQPPRHELPPLGTFGPLNVGLLAPEPDALNAGLDHLRQNAALLGLDADDLDDHIVTDQYTSEHNGVTHIYLRQTLNDLEIANAEIGVHVLPDGQVLTANSSFIGNLDSFQGQAIAPRLSAADALTHFADQMDLDLQQAPQTLQAENNTERTTLLDASGISTDDIPAYLHYVATPTGPELAWNLTVYTVDGEHGFNASVSAETGELLAVADWVAHASYNVFASPVESPNFGVRSIEVDPHSAAPNASPFGWHDTNGIAGAEFTTTRGNNANAYTDRNGDDAPDFGSAPDGGGALIFDFTLDLGQEPDVYSDAAVTNLFYWNNVIHDIHYQYGFDEASGNFQVNNYGNGGAGNDAVEAQAQDGADVGNRNNANMLTPPDGSAPRMQMFLFNTASPERDGDLDNGIIIHEYGHGVSNRLTGGPANANALQAVQSGGMGEGWSDWHSLVFTQVASDQATDGRGVGTYALNQPPNGPGIRTQRYSYDMGINDLTYDDIKTQTPPHGIGEVWAVTLWDLNWALIEGSSLDPNIPTAGLGFDPDLYNGTGGNNLAMQLVMDGMKLQPANPSFLDARDAILAADVALTGGQYQDTIWTVFARRGMGFSADDGGSSNTVNVTEAFDLPPTSEGVVEFDQPIYEIGETVQIQVRDLDLTGGGAINVNVTSSGGDSETVTLTEGIQGVFEGSITTATGSGPTSDGQLQVLAGDAITVTYNDADDGTGNPAVVTDDATFVTFMEIFNADFSDAVGNPNLDGFSINNTGGTVGGLWHLSTGRGNQAGHTADDSMYFGVGEGPLGGGTYDVGGHTAGRITSPSIDLSNVAFAKLSFNYFLDVEDFSIYESVLVLISDDGGQSFQQVAARGAGLTTPTPSWTSAEIDLNSFVGGSILIRYDFDTLDGFVNDFEGWYVDDVVVEAVEAAEVSLSVAPASVDEDDSTDLVYTFTRAGGTGGELTVDFSVGGDAIFNTDYTVSGADSFNAVAGSVTFPAGSNTATVTISPTADSVAEADETVVLTVVPGSGYSVMAPSVATGTIVNDDTSVNVSVSPIDAAEDGSTDLVYTFTRIGVFGGELIVDFTVGGDATFNTDYTVTGADTFTGSAGSVTIPAGFNTSTVTVTPTADTTVEPDEVVVLTVIAGAGYTVAPPSVATGTITNDDTSVSVSVAPITVAESSMTDLVYTFTRNGVTDGELTVDFDISGTAELNSDYTQSGAETFASTSGSVTFADGSSTATVTLSPTNDAVVESDEDVTLTLVSGLGYTLEAPSVATGTITDDDAEVNVSVAPMAVIEDDGMNLVFTFTRSNLTGGALSIDFDVSGIAIFDTDYTVTGADSFDGTSGSVTFGLASNTATVTITPTADTVVESDEDVVLMLVSGTNYSVGTQGTATGTIDNDDTATITIAALNATRDERDSGITSYSFNVTLDNAVEGGFDLPYHTEDDTATVADADYIPKTSTLDFMGTANESKSISVLVRGDTDVETDEVFRVVLDMITGSPVDPADITLVDGGTAEGTILNDDSATLTFAAVAVTQDEGDADTTEFTFTATLDQAVNGGFDVAYTTDDGTATVADGDYVNNDGMLTFAGDEGETQTITVQVNGDLQVEADEMFQVALGMVSGLSGGIPADSVIIVDGTQMGTILNDDTARLTIDDVMQNEDDGAMTFTVSLDRSVDADVTIRYATFFGTADASDFTAASGSVTFPAGTTSATFDIDITSDSIVELDEEFEVRLSNLDANGRDVLIGDSVGIGTITNDDAATVSINDVSADEDDDTITFIVSLDQASDADVTVDFATATDTADDSDLPAQSGTVTIAAGTLSTTVTLDITPDQLVELDEQFLVDLSNIQANGRDLSMGDSQGVGTILNDDTTNLTISDAVLSENDPGTMLFTLSLDQLSDADITVDFTTITDSATADDFTANSGSVTITAGTLSATIAVEVLDDDVVELDEQFFVELSNVQAAGRSVVLADDEAIGTIANDDTAGLSIDDVSIFERTAGIQVLTFTVTLDATVDSPLTVDFSTADKFAEVLDGDYQAVAGTLNFMGVAGETQTITVEVNGDTKFEIDEAFVLDLLGVDAGGRSVSIDDAQGQGTIINDDLRANLATFRSSTVPPTSINGDDFTELFSGNFDGTPASLDSADDLFFWNPLSGANRLIFGNGMVQDNPFPVAALNGNDFTDVLIGDFDEDGSHDLFFWNPATGRNRLLHTTVATSNLGAGFETDVIPQTAINGNDFTSAVVGNFDGAGPDDVFFWNPITGRNRLAHFVTESVGSDTGLTGIQTNVVDPTLINADFDSMHAGQFEEGGLDEIFFVNLTTGKNRRISFVVDTPGESTLMNGFVDSPRAQVGFNGSEYQFVEVVDLNGDGLDDLFLWNSETGQNRTAVSDIRPDAPPVFVDNVYRPRTINNEFDRLTRLVDDVFSKAGADDLFFWNPATGANRLGGI